MAKFCCAVVAVIAAQLLTSQGYAQSSTPSSNQIIEALKSKATRGASTNTGPTSKGGVNPFIAELKRKASRGLSVSEFDRPQLTAQIADHPAINLEVNFGFGESVLSDRVRPILMELGRALQNPDFKGSTFVVAGHTDKKGGAAYNQKLSEQRAAAVKDFLVSHFAIPTDNLLVVGYGFERLKKPDAPFDDDNRRVEVVNMGANVATAQ